jgi:hypothetical protein
MPPMPWPLGAVATFSGLLAFRLKTNRRAVGRTGVWPARPVRRRSRSPDFDQRFLGDLSLHVEGRAIRQRRRFARLGLERNSSAGLIGIARADRDFAGRPSLGRIAADCAYLDWGRRALIFCRNNIRSRFALGCRRRRRR